MWYGMVYFPDLKHVGLNRFREKYDPTWPLLPEHLPVLMPVPVSLDLEALNYHIRTILESWEPFQIHFKGLIKSWDHWLYLGVREGREKVEKLHDEIYSGILSAFLRQDIPYQPHLGLGFFASGEYDLLDPRAVRLAEKKYLQAVREANELDLDFWCMVDSFDLIQLNDSLTRLIIKKNYRLTQKR